MALQAPDVQLPQKVGWPHPPPLPPKSCGRRDTAAAKMTDAMRAMLDELMGKERDVPLAQRSGRRVRFYDKDVCKHELAGLCPNTLFKNTRSDLGPCGFEIHEEHLDWEEIKGEYDALSEREKDRSVIPIPGAH